MEKMQTIEQYKEIIKEGKHIMMFSADWCPDCRVIEPVLPEIEANHSEYTFHLQLKVHRVFHTFLLRLSYNFEAVKEFLLATRCSFSSVRASKTGTPPLLATS